MQVRTVSKFISDDRLNIILSIVKKVTQHPDAVTSEMQNQLSASLTIAESSLLAMIIKASITTEEEIAQILATLNDYLSILQLIGIPLETPLNQMNSKQQEAIETGQDDLMAIGRLRSLWKNANEQRDRA